MKRSFKTAYENSVKKVSLNLSYQIHQWQNNHVLSSFTILNFHKFWKCNEEKVVLLDLQSNTFSCHQIFLFQKARFVNVRQADIHNLSLVSVFHKAIFLKIEIEFFPEHSFLVWFLSPKTFDLQIPWKCLCKTDLSSLITWKMFSFNFLKYLSYYMQMYD